MSTTRGWMLVALCVCGLGVGTGSDASAQQMNFSYYTDAWGSSDQQTLHTVVNGQDNSTGCQHYDYSMVGYVSGPTGYYEDDFPGLSSWIDAPLTEGSYSVGGSATVNCSCFGSGLGAGGPSDIWYTTAHVTYYKNCTGNTSSCTCTQTNCQGGTIVCGTGPGLEVLIGDCESNMRISFIKVRFGSPTGPGVCLPGIMTPSSPGTCF
jgi:hypothetical protein